MIRNKLSWFWARTNFRVMNLLLHFLIFTNSVTKELQFVDLSRFQILIQWALKSRSFCNWPRDSASDQTCFELDLFLVLFPYSRIHDVGIFSTYIEWVTFTRLKVDSSWSILKDFTGPLRPDNSIKIHDVSPAKEIVLLLLSL